MDYPTLQLKRPGIALLLLAALSAPVLPAAHSATPAAPSAAEVYFKLPEFDAPAISPDGRSIGFIAQSNGHSCLFKIDRLTGQIQGLFSAGEGDVGAFWWIGDKRVLVQGFGAENTEYFVQELTNTPPRPIPILKGVPTNWITVMPNDTEHVVALNFWREDYLSRINLNTGHSTKLESFTSLFDYTVVSASGELRAKLWQDRGQWRIAWRARAGQPWHTLECSNDDFPTFVPAGIADDDRHILVYSRDASDTEAVMLLDPETDQRTLLARRPDHDALGLVWMAPQFAAAGATFYSNGSEDSTFFTADAQRFSAVLDNSLPGMIHRVTSSSKDGMVRIIEAWPPGYPSRYYLFDAVQHRLSLLGEQRPDIAPGTLGNVRYFSFRTRDGLTETGYVVMPRQNPDPKPVPVLVMGMQYVGEHAATAKYFSARDQYFASRGIAVAHFAVRGSAGFGHKFKQAGDFQLAGKIVQDFEDGVAQLAHDGLIDPHRVALMGYRLGGLFALHTAAVSTTFQAVVAYNTQCDLTASDISWQSSSIAETPTIIKQAGGTQAAYDLVHQFEPESFMAKLSVPAMLIYTSWYGYTFSLPQAAQIRSSFEKHHKTYAWSEIDYHASDRVKTSAYEAETYTKIADYLAKTLK